MAHSIAFDLEADRSGHDAAGRHSRSKSGWSARRKLLCAVCLSAASWLAVLTPFFVG